MHKDRYLEPISHEKLHLIYNYFNTVFNDPKPITTDLIILNEPLNNERQKVIQIDCLRTRSQLFSEQLKTELESMITHYCRIENIIYKQGLNEIAAPFLYFREVGASLGKCEIMFHLFFSNYCLNFYHDEDFNSIEVFSKMFLIVLKYHQPSIFRFMEWHKIQPQIFCISWLMTLFSSKLSLEMTYELWQVLVMENDKFFLFFLAVGLIMHNRENIIQTKNSSVLETVTHLLWKTSQELKQVVKIALLLRKNTPCSLVIFFRDRMVFEKRSNYKAINMLIEDIENLNLFLVLPSQMILKDHILKGLCQKQCYFCDLRKPLQIPSYVQKSMKDILEMCSDIRQMKYEKQFVAVDLRKDKSSHLQFEGSVFEVRLGEDIEEIEEEFLSSFMEQKGKKHFLFVLSTFSFEDIYHCDTDQLDYCKDLLNILISMSFPFLSVLEGGYLSLFKNKSEIKPQSIIIQQSIIKIDYSIKLPFPFKLPLSSIYELGARLLRHEIVTFIGQTQIMLIAPQAILILPQQRHIQHFINYFKHNNSVLQYLYNCQHTSVIFPVLSCIFIHTLKQIAIKAYHQNILVLHYERLKSQQLLPWENFSYYLQENKKRLKNLKRQWQEREKEKEKVKFEFHSLVDVSKCTEILIRYRKDGKKDK